MPIQLTTPANPGILDPGKTYAQLKIISYGTDIIGKSVWLCCRYGDTVDGEWFSGSGIGEKNHMIAGQDFLDLVGQSAQQGETVYQTDARILYAYLLDKAIYAGTYV